MKNININITDISLGTSVSVSKNSTVYTLQCLNFLLVNATTNCTLPFDNRKVKSVPHTSFPFESLRSDDFTMNITFAYDAEYNIPAGILNLNEDRQENIKFLSSWFLNQDQVEHYDVESDLLRNNTFVSFPLMEDIGLNMTVTDIITTIDIRYQASALMSIFDDSSVRLYNDTLKSVADNIVEPNILDSSGEYISFPIEGIIRINTLVDTYQNVIAVPVSYRPDPNNSPPVTDFTPTTTSTPSIINTLKRINKFNSTISVPEAIIYNYTFDCYTRYETLPMVLKYFFPDVQNYLPYCIDEQKWDELIYYRDLENLVVIVVCVPIVFIIICFPVWFWIWYPQGYDYNHRDKAELAGYINLNEDIYTISRVGSFNATVKEQQLVVNDINGIKIFAENGDLLFETKDFCNLPFIKKDDVQISRYWNTDGRVLRIRGSFSHFQNHNLNFGGIKIGDFDGDGIDDLWCHYPGSTKGYEFIDANQIIFDPLEQSLIKGDKCSYTKTLSVPNWCKDGIIKIGFFNFDKQSDILCIENGVLSLLYGQEGGEFLTASSDVNGKLNLNLPDKWNKDAKIVVGDFDGDKYSDLMLIQQGSLDILYGKNNSFFVNRPLTNNQFLSYKTNEIRRHATDSPQSRTFENILELFYNTDINKIIVGDFDGDGRDDISLIRDVENIFIYSNVKNYTNSFITAQMVLKDIKFDKITKLQEIKYSTLHQNLVINNSIAGSQSAYPHVTPSVQKPLVNDITFPFECLNLEKFNYKITFVSSGNIKVPAEFILADTSINSVFDYDLEISAKWFDNNLEINSNLINFANIKSDIPSGSCLIKNIENKYLTTTMHYSAKALVYLEDGNELLQGSNFINSLRQVTENFSVNDDGVSATLNINGHLSLNLLGITFNEITECASEEV